LETKDGIINPIGPRSPCSYIGGAVSAIPAALCELARKIWHVVSAIIKGLVQFYSSPVPASYSLAAVFQETCQALQAGKYTPPGDEEVQLNLETMKEGTKVWTDEGLLKEDMQLDRRSTYTPVFEVINEDTVDGVLELIKPRSWNPAAGCWSSFADFPLVLNMANRYTKGGGVIRGCKAQEEELCRKTGLYDSLEQAQYPIPEHGCIYSPQVPIIRTKTDHSFEWISNPVPYVSFVSSAAYDLREKSKEKEISDEIYADGMRKKIKAQILCALYYGHDSLVLGAFGCGAFQNDPNTVAQIYQEVLATYQQYFKRIRFSILVTCEADKANIAAFSQMFSSLPSQV
jgi:uncharacterized protein (TIGR02452 family)